LSHANCIASTASSVGAKPCKSDGTNDSFVWFARAMTPMIIVVESAEKGLAAVNLVQGTALTRQSTSQ